LSFFGRRRKEAQCEYERFAEDAFGQALASPWRGLKLGLVLGGEGLLGGVRGLVGRKPGQQEVSWMTSAGSPETRRKVAQALAESILDRRAKVWVRVTFGGERRVDADKEYGYKDGSAITQIIKPLRARAVADRSLRMQLAKIRNVFGHEMSCVKS
jgi:hypothetical protein